jgi:hypothetical protein
MANKPRLRAYSKLSALRPVCLVTKAITVDYCRTRTTTVKNLLDTQWMLNTFLKTNVLHYSHDMKGTINSVEG